MPLTWDNFDKAFWVSSTNMKNLILAAIGASGNIQQLQQNQSQLTQQLLSVIQLLEQHIQNQQQINQQFFLLFNDVADILADHEQRLQNGGL